MFHSVLLTRFLTGSALSAAALAFIPNAALAQEAEGVLKRAASAMGDLKSIRYAGEGTGWTFGQAFKPGMPWPKINVHSQTRTIDYDTASMNEEITLSRGEPKGGGGYPPLAQQSNNQFLSAGYAWNQADAFSPLPPNAPPPAQANPNHLVLVANLERLKLSVDRILPLHGRVVPLADLYAAVKAPMPK